MLYDLANPLQKRNFQARCEALCSRDSGIVELTEKKPVRTNSQNRYLHVLLGYFASQYGETEDYVKRAYFKSLVNPDIFVAEKTDPFLGQVKTLRSSSDLDTAEMTTAIERFRNWSAKEAGIYLASPEETDFINQMEIEIQRNRNWQ